MLENSRREAENSRRERPEMRADFIRAEMADAVRLLGADGRSAAEQNHRASRQTGLPVPVIERLRWRKVKRIPADVADVVREALARSNRRAEALAKHEALILKRRVQALADLADNPTDPDFYSARVAGVVEQARRIGILDRPVDEEA